MGEPMTGGTQNPAFILNQWIAAMKEGLVNTTQIRAARNEAADQILQILKNLEVSTGMVVSSVTVDSTYNDDMQNTGTTGVKISLELV